MQEDRVILFYRRIGLYNETLFKKIKDSTILIGRYDPDFCGIFLKDDGTYRVVLPMINSVFDELVWVHEYAHAMILDIEDEVFPNIMESMFINMFVDDKTPFIDKTQEEIQRSKSEKHTLAKRIKLSIISML